LDPNQNSSFVDHYLDIPVDFSGVLFVCTANDESTIPGPLLDRMEMIRLTGYDIPEKVAIAERYLVPKVFAESGLMVKNGGDSSNSNKENLKEVDGIDNAALHLLVKNYSRESGVRSLEKLLEKIARKIAFRRASEMDTTSPTTSEEVAATPKIHHVTVDTLEEYVGKPLFQQDTIYQNVTPTDEEVVSNPSKVVVIKNRINTKTFEFERRKHIF
jgi:Lon-like ATP-dependent protease